MKNCGGDALIGKHAIEIARTRTMQRVVADADLRRANF